VKIHVEWSSLWWNLYISLIPYSRYANDFDSISSAYIVICQLNSISAYNRI
jgi:hypothetical protein